MFHGDHIYPETQFVDAFSHSWSKGKFYAFPPFSLILRCLQKIEIDKWEGIMIVLVWPTQPWYPKLICLLVNTPRLLPVTTETLYFPSKPSHSLQKHLFLLALRRWGRFARRNVCDSVTEIPYWWCKICPESGQKCWLVDRVVTLF